MHQAGTLASYGVRWIGTDVRSFKARFRNVYWPGDPLFYQGTVSSIRKEEEQNLVDLDLSCWRTSEGGNARIVDAWMTIRIGE